MLIHYYITLIEHIIPVQIHYFMFKLFGYFWNIWVQSWRKCQKRQNVKNHVFDTYIKV